MTGLWATLVVNRRFQPVLPDVLPGNVFTFGADLRGWAAAGGPADAVHHGAARRPQPADPASLERPAARQRTPRRQRPAPQNPPPPTHDPPRARRRHQAAIDTGTSSAAAASTTPRHGEQDRLPQTRQRTQQAHPPSAAHYDQPHPQNVRPLWSAPPGRTHSRNVMRGRYGASASTTCWSTVNDTSGGSSPSTRGITANIARTSRASNDLRCMSPASRPDQAQAGPPQVD
jgi:hypothetical protein